MPGEVMRLLDKFYAGEGIMGKIAGLQWGEGPRLYEDAIDEENNRFYRRWKLDPEITADLESWDYTTVLHRSLVDLTHMQGFFIKFVSNEHARTLFSLASASKQHSVMYYFAFFYIPFFITGYILDRYAVVVI